MKFLKVKRKITEAVEDFGKLPPEKYIDYQPEVDPMPDDVMPISFVRSAEDIEKNREEANKKIADRRKIALDAVEAEDKDRFKNMSAKEEKFNKGEKITLDESLFLTEADEEDTDEKESDDIVKDVKDFKPWAMAVTNYDKIKKAGKLDALNGIVSELYPDNIDKSTLNDLLAFDYEFLKDQLGIEE